MKKAECWNAAVEIEWEFCHQAISKLKKRNKRMCSEHTNAMIDRAVLWNKSSNFINDFWTEDFIKARKKISTNKKNYKNITGNKHDKQTQQWKAQKNHY